MSEPSKTIDPTMNDLYQRITCKASRLAADALMYASGEDLRKSFKPTEIKIAEHLCITNESNER